MRSEMFMEILTLCGAKSSQFLRSAFSTLKMLTLAPQTLQGRLLLFVIRILLVLIFYNSPAVRLLPPLPCVVWPSLQRESDAFAFRGIMITSSVEYWQIQTKTDVDRHWVNKCSFMFWIAQLVYFDKVCLKEKRKMSHWLGFYMFGWRQPQNIPAQLQWVYISWLLRIYLFSLHICHSCGFR